MSRILLPNIESEKDKSIPEKDKINIYENDDAYMLNDYKDNNYLDDELENIGMELAGNLNPNLDIDIENEEENQDSERYNQYQKGNNYNLHSERENQNNQDENNNEDEEDYDELGTIRNKEEANIKNNNNVQSNVNINNNNNLNSANNQNNSEINDRSKSLSNLITLKYISVCQCCKENFNSHQNIPFLLKCGHFFCRQCIINNFTEDDGSVSCPDDGLMANSISDLKLLNNLIINRTVDEEDEMESNNNFCKVHPGQKLSHYVEDTHEVICVYCAFKKFKTNPKYEIKEIQEKCKEILNDVDSILNDNQHYVEILQQTLKDIKDNKQNEEERVSNLYDEFIKYLEEKKNEMFENINNMFASNADKLSEKLDYFSMKMEEAEELKAHIVAVQNNSSEQINQVMSRFTQFIRQSGDTSQLNLELIEFKFAHDDENKLIKYLNNFGDLKSKSKFIKFAPKPKNIINSNFNEKFNTNLNLNSISSVNYDFESNREKDIAGINYNNFNPKKLYDNNFTVTSGINKNDNRTNNNVKYGNSSNLYSNENVNNIQNENNDNINNLDSSDLLIEGGRLNTNNYLLSSNDLLLSAENSNIRPSSSSK